LKTNPENILKSSGDSNPAKIEESSIKNMQNSNQDPTPNELSDTPKNKTTRKRINIP
jgi:hypothetical protein